MKRPKIIEPVMMMEGAYYKLYKLEYEDEGTIRMDIFISHKKSSKEDDNEYKIKIDEHTKEADEYVDKNFTKQKFDTIEPNDPNFRTMLDTSEIILKYSNGFLDIRGKGQYKDLVRELRSIPYMKDLFIIITKDDYFRRTYENLEFMHDIEYHL